VVTSNCHHRLISNAKNGVTVTLRNGKKNAISKNVPGVLFVKFFRLPQQAQFAVLATVSNVNLQAYTLIIQVGVTVLIVRSQIGYAIQSSVNAKVTPYPHHLPLPILVTTPAITS
jgi:hypothetical protein